MGSFLFNTLFYSTTFVVFIIALAVCSFFTNIFLIAAMYQTITYCRTAAHSCYAPDLVHNAATAMDVLIWMFEKAAIKK